MAGPLVNIEHRDGRRYQIEAGDFEKDGLALKDPAKQEQFRDPDLTSFREAGFRITTIVETGEPYKPPAARAAARDDTKDR